MADKKIIILEDGGAENKFSDKLFTDIEKLIIGYSGSRRVFESFRNRIVEYMTGFRNTYKEYPSITNIYSQIEEISHRLSETYRQDSFDLLVGVSSERSPDNRAQLRYFYYDGTMEPVFDYKVIGTGAPYGAIFLKQNWAPDLTMEQVAELGYFVIKYRKV